ncbi:AraC family transcriptional regulator [Microbacterium sp. NEAU-LLC]|uniref:AraC family transcriptional regulator n=1 Tax=Microbacterium helvum TaxID=2773713 RepID=A0ABR8NP43_9MICO|nr:helix-turn-helix domain-containing protein [Microbacterium helvum]MBD3942391.1 AraC family transcriptional regulator [Microbacterium helvum]
MTDPNRGVLYPDRLPHFTRLPPGEAASDLVEWYWIPQWDLPEGVESRQAVLSYPAANLAVEPDGVTLWGVTTRAGERVLRGSGWAVGALLRPAALAQLTAAPASLADQHIVLDEPALQSAVVAAMPDVQAAVAIVEAWLVARVGVVTPEARLANAMAELLMTDPTTLRLDDAAERLRVSARTLQRLAHRTVGLSPAAMIRRRRLQEAAQRVRDDPSASLAAIAADLGYADQAHLANDFRRMLGFTPSDYRGER